MPDTINTEYLLKEAREAGYISFRGSEVLLDGCFELSHLEQLVEHIKVYGYKDLPC